MHRNGMSESRSAVSADVPSSVRDCNDGAMLNFCEEFADKILDNELNLPAFRDGSRDATRVSRCRNPV